MEQIVQKLRQISQNQPISVQSLKWIEKYIDIEDLAFASKVESIVFKKIQHLKQNWQSYKKQYTQPIIKFLKIVNKKISIIRHSKKIFNKYNQLIDHFFKNIASQELNLEKNKQSQLVFQSIRKSQKSFMDEWQKLYTKYQCFQAKENTHEKTHEKFFKEHREREKSMQIQNLCCTPFFYHGWNCYDQRITKLEPAVFSSIYHDHLQQKSIKQTICGFLNANGGVLLFDCSQEKLQIIINGCHMNEKQKNAHLQRLIAYAKQIQPKIVINTDYRVDFVPVRLNPLKKQHKKLSQTTVQMHFAHQIYVTRITILPSNQCKAYYLKNKQDITMILREQGQNKKLKGEQIYQLISNKIRKFGDNSVKPYAQLSYHQGKCKQVEKNQSQYFEESSLSWKYLSLVMCKEDRIDQFKKQFKQISLKRKFKHYNFRLSLNSYLIYHNVYIDQLKLKLKNIKQQGKNLIIIPVTKIQIIQIDSEKKKLKEVEEEIKKIQKFLWKQIKKEKIIIKSQTNSQLIFETYSLQGSIFAFFWLKHFSYKVQFKYEDKQRSESENKVTHQKSQK